MPWKWAARYVSAAPPPFDAHTMDFVERLSRMHFHCLVSHCLDASRQRTLRSTRRSDQVAARCPCSWIDLNRPSSKAAVLPGRVDRMNSLVERRSDQLCPIAAGNGRNLVDVVDTCSRSEQSLDTTRRKHHKHAQGRIRWIAPGVRLAPFYGNA